MSLLSAIWELIKIVGSLCVLVTTVGLLLTLAKAFIEELFKG